MCRQDGGRDRLDNTTATALQQNEPVRLRTNKKGKGTYRYLQNILRFREDLLLAVFESALTSEVCSVTVPALSQMGLSVPVLAILQGCATTQEKPDYSPRPKGTAAKSHRHVVAPNRLTRSVSEHKPEPKRRRTNLYFHQKIFPPPLVHQDSLVIEFALTPGAYE